LLTFFLAAASLVVYSQFTHGVAADEQATQDISKFYDKANKLQTMTKNRVFKLVNAKQAADKKGEGGVHTMTPNWFANNTKFWFKNDLKGNTKEFILVDAEKGTRGPAFDHKKLAESLSKANSAMYTADALPFNAIKFVDENKAIEFTAASSNWKCNLTSYEIVKTGKAEAKKDEPPPDKKKIDDEPFDLTPWDIIEEPWQFDWDEDDWDAFTPAQQKKKGGGGKKDGPGDAKSKDGKWVVETKDYNIYLKEVSSGKVTQLTKDGVEKNAYGTIRWSPSSKSFVYFKTDPGENPKRYLIDSVPKGQFRPTFEEKGYRTPGDKVDTREMFVFDIASQKSMKADLEKIDFGPFPTLHWDADKSKFSFERIYRGHQRVRVVEVDTTNGKVRDIIDEKSPTRIVRTTGTKQAWHVLQYFDDTNEILWMSERDGWNHLYLIDVKKGAVKNQITQGPWVVRNLEFVDQKKRQLWFAASGRNLDQDPHFLHHYRINFDGTGLVALTEGNGNHTIEYSPDKKYVLDTYGRNDMAPVTNLRRVSDGSFVCEVERTDISALLQAGWKLPEPFSALGRDGKTDIWGVAYFPTHFDPKVKYPVIEYIYAGPWTTTAPHKWETFSARQALAELGFVVVVIDGMGLPNRSRAFHDVSYKNNGDCGLPDRILWMKALAKKYPNIDLNKIGIYGHSGGGYSSLRALLTHGDFYKVAVSSSGNHDPRGYNLPYTEQWMSWPVGDYYVDQSNVTHAKNLKGKLFLIHGEVDDNVSPNMNTMKVVDALIKANKDFDLLIMPTKKHAVSGAYVTRRTYDYFVRHLLGVEPPSASLFPQDKGGAGGGKKGKG